MEAFKLNTEQLSYLIDRYDNMKQRGQKELIAYVDQNIDQVIKSDTGLKFAQKNKEELSPDSQKILDNTEKSKILTFENLSMELNKRSDPELTNTDEDVIELKQSFDEENYFSFDNSFLEHAESIETKNSENDISVDDSFLASIQEEIESESDTMHEGTLMMDASPSDQHLDVEGMMELNSLDYTGISDREKERKEKEKIMGMINKIQQLKQNKKKEKMFDLSIEDQKER